MSSLLPIRSEPSTGDEEPRVVNLEGEDADQVFKALSSATARRIVAALHEDPMTQSEIAETIDSSVQNVRYHLDKLEDAGLVEVVDTWYSSRGNEMSVYAPADGALIVSGDEGRASRLKTALSRLIGGVGVLGLASLGIQRLAERFGAPAGGAGGGSPGGFAGAPDADDRQFNDGDGAITDGNDTSTLEPTDVTTDGKEATRTVSDTTTLHGDATRTATEGTQTSTAAPTTTPTDQTATVTRSATETTTTTTTKTTAATDGGVDTTTSIDPSNVTAGNLTDSFQGQTTTVADAAVGTGGIEPGLAFFLGGVSVLLVLTALWYWSLR